MRADGKAVTALLACAWSSIRVRIAQNKENAPLETETADMKYTQGNVCGREVRAIWKSSEACLAREGAWAKTWAGL